jgi:hypothetical protein
MAEKRTPRQPNYETTSGVSFFSDLTLVSPHKLTFKIRKLPPKNKATRRFFA